MSKLTDYYNSNNIKVTEGYSQQVKEQVEFLKETVNQTSIHNVMEIGFNAGHSAELFLSANKNINLVSFDIGSHDYVKFGKELIDTNFPNRHTLIIGNSLNTVPEYAKKTNKKFDLIFIDGGHSYEVAKNDLLNCKQLAHENTILILDDTMNNNKWIMNWNNGPNRAWEDVKKMNFVKEVGSIDYSPGRGQSWGYYNF